MDWVNDPSLITEGSSSFTTSTSSLQYVNSQLVAHGFSHSPGISLDGLSNNDTERVVKCLLSLLGQRIQDMDRTNEYTTKIRTMGYDNDRLKGMYQDALEKAAHAERETSTWKSRASAAEKASQASEKRCKAQAAENQRLRTTLQAVRTGAQTEIKKFEKEKDKLLERLGKVADSRSSGQLKCSNTSALGASESNLGGGRGYLDIALEDAENRRTRLSAENDDLRKLVLDCTNEMQEVLHSIRPREEGRCIEDEPTPVTLATIFPLAPPNAARDKFNSLLNTLKDSFGLRPTLVKEADRHDMVKLQQLVDILRSELDQARSHTSDYATRAQSLFDKFVEEKRAPSDGEMGDADMSIGSIARDEERLRLEAKSQELAQDRWKLTESAVQLGVERAELEAQRLQFLEERRGWEVQKVIPDVPHSPQPVASVSRTKAAKALVKKALAPLSRRKSHARKASPGKKLINKKAGPRSPKRKAHTLETELIQMPPPSPPPPSRETIARMTSTADLLASFSQGPNKFVLPTEFVIPPPSPEASLPTLSPKSSSESIPQLNLAGPSSLGDPFVQVGPSLLQRTPVLNKKKSLPYRVTHAYSPVKPSPLSRILMMADESLPSVHSDDDDDDIIEKPHLVDFKSLARPPLATLLEEDDTGKLAGVGDSGRVLTLEEELGITMDREDHRAGGPMVIEDIGGSPLKEKNVRRSPSPRKAAAPSRRPITVTTTAPKSTKPAIPKRPVAVAATSKDKGKGREVETKTMTRTRTAAAAGLDKENSAAKRLKPSPPDTKKRPAVAAAGVSGRTRSAPTTSRGGGPGPRRIPVVKR